MSLTFQTLPFLLHALIESVAALTFIRNPSSQLPPSLRPAPKAVILVFQCYGGLLLTTNLLALVFLRRDFDETSRLVALIFAFWHLWPSYRAVMRLMGAVEGEDAGAQVLGGPLVHLGAHGVLLILFLGAWISNVAS